MRARALRRFRPQLSDVSDFVKVSMNRREMNKLGKDLTAAEAARKAGRPASLVTIYSRYLTPAVYALVVLLYWGVPLAAVPPGWFTPFGWLLATPGQPTGLVSAGGWCLVCHFVLGRAGTWVAEKTGYYTPAPAGGMGSMLQKVLQQVMPA